MAIMWLVKLFFYSLIFFQRLSLFSLNVKGLKRENIKFRKKTHKSKTFKTKYKNNKNFKTKLNFYAPFGSYFVLILVFFLLIFLNYNIKFYFVILIFNLTYEFSLTHHICDNIYRNKSQTRKTMST